MFGSIDPFRKLLVCVSTAHEQCNLRHGGNTRRLRFGLKRPARQTTVKDSANSAAFHPSGCDNVGLNNYSLRPPKMLASVSRGIGGRPVPKVEVSLGRLRSTWEIGIDDKCPSAVRRTRAKSSVDSWSVEGIVWDNSTGGPVRKGGRELASPCHKSWVNAKSIKTV